MSVTFYPSNENAPENMSVNMSNMNAREFMSVLGFNLDDDLCGKFDKETCKNIVKQVTHVIANGYYEAFMSDTIKSGNLTVIGRNREYVHVRLRAIRSVAEYCIANNVEMIYN